MTKINGNILDQTCPDYTITISKQTADILRQRPEDRVSRYDAFRQLVELAAHNQSHGNPESEDGTATVRISALADTWHWHRHTVKTFLDELAEMNKSDNKMSVFFHNLKFDGSYLVYYFLQ